MQSTADVYEFQVAGEALSLKKKATAKTDFDDGVLLHIPAKEQPRHL